jgi:protease I
MAKKVLLLVGDYVEDYEAMVPFQAMESVGIQVDTVAPDRKKGDVVPTAVHDFTGDQTYKELRGHNFAINKDFDSVNTDDYDGLYIACGSSDEYIRLNKRVIEITKVLFD